MSISNTRVFSDSDELALMAAKEINRLAQERVKDSGKFSIALSGGSTPKKLYKLLADPARFPDFPWEETHFFFGDERTVPPDHADSNFRMTHETLFSGDSAKAIPPNHIHRIRGEEKDASLAANHYEVELANYFGGSGIPQFDLVLLGMGDDGHTASLFPGTAGLTEERKWVIANWVEKFKTFRITFTFPVINHARNIMFLVAGPDKTQRVSEILGQSPSEKSKRPSYPIEHVKPGEGTAVWYLDKAAAAKL